MCLASVAHHRQHTAVKAGTLEAHAFGNAGSGTQIRPGDEILVLPKIDVKSRQVMKDLSQIL